MPRRRRRVPCHGSPSDSRAWRRSRGRLPRSPSRRRRRSPAGTVTQPIFGGEDAELAKPQDAADVLAAQKTETDAALAQLRHVLELSIQQRGADDPSTLRARTDIAVALWHMGRYDEAIEMEEELVNDSARVLGEEHPEALTARANLASTYWTAGRSDDAIAIEEAVLADAERILGLDHLATLTTRSNLAFSSSSAGRKQEAVEVQRQVVADRARVLEPDDPDTLDARANLASACWNADLVDEAIATEEQIVEESLRINGADHIDTHAGPVSAGRLVPQGEPHGGGSVTSGPCDLRVRAAPRQRSPGDDRGAQDARAEQLAVGPGPAEALQVAGDGDDAQQTAVAVDDGHTARVGQQREVAAGRRRRLGRDGRSLLGDVERCAPGVDPRRPRRRESASPRSARRLRRTPSGGSYWR